MPFGNFLRTRFTATLLAAFCLSACQSPTCQSVGAAEPNIVFVLCDDLGYGDVQCLNPERGKILTPNVDRLAREGMVFTDAHSGSSVCTPTRYGLLTGRYAWRTKLQRGVVQGFEPCLIEADRPTVAGFLKSNGYRTGIVGKWHLNFDYQDPASGTTLKRQKKNLPPVGSTIPDGPITRGFDSFHGFHHAREMKVVIDGDQVIEHDEEINMLPRLTREAVGFIDRMSAGDSGQGARQPFFLYVPFGSPHTPIVPSKQWQGKSGINPYADFVMQTDAGFGEILEAIDRNGFRDDTLVIFSSDNGCSPQADMKQLRSHGHFPSGPYRGHKADIWDGGHRIPFIVRWPGKVEPGSTSSQTICLTDLFATCGEILGESLPADAGQDSVSFLPALSGGLVDDARTGIVHHSISGHFAYRSGKWKLCLAKASGGWSKPTEKSPPKNGPVAQLYDMESDPGETTNLYQTRPRVAQRLLAQLESDIVRGRSTPGEHATNDVESIQLWKSK